MSVRGEPLIKICGVTRPEDAALAVELGADLVGLNFLPPSPATSTRRRSRARSGDRGRRGRRPG